MKFFLSFILLTFAFRSTAQTFPFQVTFSKMYIGQYDVDAHKTSRIDLYEGVQSIDADFDGSSRLTVVYRSKFKTDTMNLVMNLKTETKLVDAVEYKFETASGYLVFLWYNLYYVPGIREMSIFKPSGETFFYIKHRITDR